MVDFNLDPSIGMRRSRRQILTDISNRLVRRAPAFALVLGDLAAGALALLATDYLLPGRASSPVIDGFNLLLLVASYFVFGLYADRRASPHERLRQRALGILLYTGVAFLSVSYEAGILHAPAFGAVQGALLLVLGFYVELAVSRLTAQDQSFEDEIHRDEAGAPAQARAGAQQANGASVDVLKRVLDLAVAVPASILMAPVIGLMILAIKLIDPGPAVYVQTRVGRDGRQIRLFKIRSMYVDADKRLQEHLRTDADAQAEWLRYYKLKDDPRILPHIGHFIRRSSLDELPQLWNVVLGDMTLVGPRPLPAYHAESFDEEFQRLRASVTPGVTGVTQVFARRSELDMQKVHDLFYIRNRSIWLDLYILLQTVPAVLTGNGAR